MKSQKCWLPQFPKLTKTSNLIGENVNELDLELKTWLETRCSQQGVCIQSFQKISDSLHPYIRICLTSKTKEKNSIQLSINANNSIYTMQKILWRCIKYIHNSSKN